jgi:hypothetical protein
MKWNEKGRAFDELGAKLQAIEAVYFFGAGVNGRAAYEKYRHKIQIRGFIENDPAKQGGVFCGLRVFAPGDVRLTDGEAIVITAQPLFAREIMAQLRGRGDSKSVQAFPAQTFFPVFDMYKFGELCLSSISFLVTTVCNLRCKHCLNFTPYIKNPGHRPLEGLKTDLETLFSKIDTLLLLHLSGGEPLLYPDLPALIAYIAQRFGRQLGRLEMTTNGTIVPSEELCVTMRDSGLYLIVDDYRAALPQYGGAYEALLQKLDAFGVAYQPLRADTWIDLAPFETDHVHWTEARLRAHFDACDVDRQEYREGTLYLCNYASYADFAGIQPARPGEYLSFSDLGPQDRRALMEFRLGYSEKGYTEFCKRCSGYNNNPNAVRAAEQAE